MRGDEIVEMIRAVIFFLILSTVAGQLAEGTKYKPYISLVAGFMLLILVIQPLLEWMGKDIEIQDVFSEISQEADLLSFEDNATGAKEEQIQKGVKTVLEEYGVEVQEVTVSVDEEGSIQEITIAADNAKSKEQQIKTMVSRFYNVEKANINISE